MFIVCPLPESGARNFVTLIIKCGGCFMQPIALGFLGEEGETWHALDDQGFIGKLYFHDGRDLETCSRSRTRSLPWFDKNLQ